MREWVVASGIIESPDGLLMVENRRRTGGTDWSTPGGVVEVQDGESVLDGLTREVHEETGISVTDWQGPAYEVEGEALGLGWRFRVEVHVATAFSGELRVDDPDGIVVDARWVSLDQCDLHLEACPVWVREPLSTWLVHRPVESSLFRYRIDGDDRARMSVVRL